jgi:large subunit ribosomal protein L21
MYAIIESGGKQHKVVEGEVLRLEKLDAEAGATVNFSNVLLLAMDDKVTIGAPYVKNAQVLAEVVEQGRGEKIRIVKFKRRKHHQKSTGHRQYFTEVKITGIEMGGKAKPKAAEAEAEPKDAPAEKKSATKKPTAKKAAAKKPAVKKETAAKKPAEKKAAAAKKPAAKKTAAKKPAAKKVQDKTED